MKKKLLALILASTMLASMLAACGGGSDNPQGSSAPGGSSDAPGAPSSNVAVGGDAEKTNYVLPELKMDIEVFNVNPLSIRSSGPVTYSVYEMLYTTENGIGSDMVPLLADANRGGNNSMGLKGMDHEAGSTEYLFYIYDYITDSAGNKITASDVVFSFEQTRDFKEVSGWGPIEGWEAVDDTTIKMTTTRELDQKGEIENILLRCYIFSEKAFNDSASGFTTDGCGTGPYAITDFVQDASVTCEARSDYWQTNEELRPRSAQANVQKFSVYAISDYNTKVTAIQAGDIDLICTLAASSAGSFVDNPDYQVYSFPQNGIHYLGLNCSSDSIMSNPDMRLAIYYALSNENLANILNASGIPAYQPIAAYGHELFSDYLTKWDSQETYVTEYNLEKSKEYADKAGYNGETIYLLSTTDSTGIVENVQNMLINAGFKVELKSFDKNTTFANRDNSEAWDIYYNTTRSSDYMTSLWSHVMDPASFGGRTENFIVDEKHNQLLDAAMNINATEEDLDAYWQYLLENAYFYPMLRETQAMVLPKSVSNVWLDDKNYYIPGAAYYTEQ